MSKVEIKKGQVWKRIADGKEVKVTRYLDLWDDVSWISTDGKRSGGKTFGTNFRRHYALIKDADDE